MGYAKVDKAGIYNILIMEEKQSIIAAGAGASTKIVLKRTCHKSMKAKREKTSLIRQENVKAIDAYISRDGRDDRTKRRMVMALKKKPVTGMKDVMPAEMEIPGLPDRPD